MGDHYQYPKTHSQLKLNHNFGFRKSHFRLWFVQILGKNQIALLYFWCFCINIASHIAKIWFFIYLLTHFAIAWLSIRLFHWLWNKNLMINVEQVGPDKTMARVKLMSPWLKGSRNSWRSISSWLHWNGDFRQAYYHINQCSVRG